MIGFVTIGTDDLARAAAFYDALLADEATTSTLAISATWTATNSACLEWGARGIRLH